MYMYLKVYINSQLENTFAFNLIVFGSSRLVLIRFTLERFENL